VEDLARPVPHRQLVVTLPKLIGPYFKHDRSLLTDLSRWVYGCVHELMQGLADEPVRPGCVTVLQLAGDLLNLQPHLHSLLTSGAFDASGTRFYPLPSGFLDFLEVSVRDRVLRGLLEKGILPLEPRRAPRAERAGRGRRAPARRAGSRRGRASPPGEPAGPLYAARRDWAGAAAATEDLVALRTARDRLALRAGPEPPARLPGPPAATAQYGGPVPPPPLAESLVAAAGGRGVSAPSAAARPRAPSAARTARAAAVAGVLGLPLLAWAALGPDSPAPPPPASGAPALATADLGPPAEPAPTGRPEPAPPVGRGAAPGGRAEAPATARADAAPSPTTGAAPAGAAPLDLLVAARDDRPRAEAPPPQRPEASASRTGGAVR